MLFALHFSVACFREVLLWTAVIPVAVVQLKNSVQNVDLEGLLENFLGLCIGFLVPPAQQHVTTGTESFVGLCLVKNHFLVYSATLRKNKNVLLQHNLRYSVYPSCPSHSAMIGYILGHCWALSQLKLLLFLLSSFSNTSTSQGNKTVYCEQDTWSRFVLTAFVFLALFHWKTFLKEFRKILLAEKIWMPYMKHRRCWTSWPKAN